MHSRLVILSALFLVMAIAGCRTTSGAGPVGLETDLLAHTVRDEAGGFVVRMPVAPSIERDSFETPRGTLTSVTYSGELSSALYVVTLNLFPEGALEPGSVAAQLEAARDASLNSTGGEIVDEIELEVDGHPALEITVLVDGGAYRTRMIMDGSRMFQVLVASTEEGEVFSDLSSSFLDSFSLDRVAAP